MTAQIMTHSGRVVDLLDFHVSDVSVSDVAYALSHLCRYCGHVEFYSVAQHSVLVSLACAPEDALWGLLHDAAEAYVADVPGPLKRTPALAGYRAVEDRIQAVIARKFRLPTSQPESVDLADKRLALAEMRDLFPVPRDSDYLRGIEPATERVVPVGPARANRLFLERYVELVLMRSRGPAGV